MHTLIIVVLIAVVAPAALMFLLHMQSPVRYIVRLTRGHYRLYGLGVCPHCCGDALRECPICNGLSGQASVITTDGVERANRRIAKLTMHECWTRYRHLVKRGVI